MTAPDFSIAMITIDCRDPQRLAAFWSAATGSPVVADHAGYVIVGSEPALGFQQVPEPTAGKNRVHLDCRLADAEDVAREQVVERLRSLGATVGDTHSMNGLTWTVLYDPEENVFCVGG